MQRSSPPEHTATYIPRQSSQCHRRKDSYDSSDAAKSPTSSILLLNQAYPSRTRGLDGSSPYATPRQTKGTNSPPATQSNGIGAKPTSAAWAGVSPYLQPPPPPRSPHQHASRGLVTSENAPQAEINMSPRKVGTTQQQMAASKQGRMGQLMHAYGIMNNSGSNSHNSRGSTPNTYDIHGGSATGPGRRERRGGWSTPPMTAQYGTKTSGLRGIHHSSSLGRQAGVRHHHTSYSIVAGQHHVPVSNWGQEDQQGGWFDESGSNSAGSQVRGIATTSDDSDSDPELCATDCSPVSIPIIVTEGDTVVETHTLSGGNLDGNSIRHSGGNVSKPWSRPASRTRSSANAVAQQASASVARTHNNPIQTQDLGASFSYDDIPIAEAEEADDDNGGDADTVLEEESMYGGVTLDQFMAHYQTTPASQAATSGLGQPELQADVCCSGQETCSGEEEQYTRHGRSAWDSATRPATTWSHQETTSNPAAATNNPAVRVRPHSGIRLRALDAAGYGKQSGNSILSNAFSHMGGSNHLDLRPATAATPTTSSPDMALAGLQGGCVLAGSTQQENVAPIRQVDLASLPQSLFTPSGSRGSTVTQQSLSGSNDFGRRPVAEYGLAPVTTQAWAAQAPSPVMMQAVRAPVHVHQPVTASEKFVGSATTTSQKQLQTSTSLGKQQQSSRHAACQGLQEADAQSVQAAAAAALVRPSGPSPGNTRQVQSARPGTRDDTPIDPTVWRDYIEAQLERPPSRQKPPSASLHLWQPVGRRAEGKAPTQTHGPMTAGKLNTRPSSAMPVTSFPTRDTSPGDKTTQNGLLERTSVDQHSNVMRLKATGAALHASSVLNANTRTAW